MNASESIDNSNEPAKDKASYWSSVMDDWEGSNESQQKYCAKRNISFPQFGYWRSQLKRGKKKTATAMFPVQIARTLSRIQTADIQIKLPNGIELTLPENFSEQSLSQLLRLLGVASC